MKRIITLFSGGAIMLLLAINFSCSKKSSSPTASSGPDSVLINIGNNIILPSYTALGSAVKSLDSAITDFNSSPDASKLTNVQRLFDSAYTDWQSVSEYDGLGPALANQPPLSGLDIFPATDSVINNNIVNGNYNVNVLANIAAKGFPALDYLLFAGGSNTLANYTTDANATNRKLYLAAVSADIKTEVTAVVTAWTPTGGNYINTFINGTGNSVSSSLGLLINSLDQDFEILKNDRLGIPLGKLFGGATSTILPTEVEAYYSGISAHLALAQLKAAQKIYLGTNTTGGTIGMGLDAYVVKANAKYNGGSLSDTIKAHFVLAIADLQATPDPLSMTIQSNPASADAAYTEIQKLVVLLKTDMPSSLGVLITYGDNDGD